MTSKNPLLDYGEFTPYKEIKASDIVPAVKAAVEQSQKNLEEILSQLDNAEDLNFDSVHGRFIELEEIIEKVWSPVENLLSLCGEKDIRDAAEEARPLVVEFYNNYSLDPRVYKLIRDYDASADAKKLSGEYQRYHQDTLRDLKLAGAELEGEEKEEFKKLNLELSQLSQKFSDNVTDSKFELVIKNEADLSGLPDDIKDSAKHKAEELGLDGWVFNLDYPSFGPFMKFADNGKLRKELYLQYLGKASPSKHPERNNEELIPKICAAKERKAALLGFKNYAELSLQTKMAESPEKVKEFLERMAEKVKPLAEKEYQALVDFQKEIGYQNTENNSDKVFPWDNAYLSEKLRKKEYAFDTNLLKPYFELENTKTGMLKIAETLFGISIEKSKEPIQVWHEDVEVYEVKEGSRSVGLFFMDLYPRDTKRQGAWVMPLVQGQKETEGYRRPQCVLSCNLTKPRKDQPSLLTHMEVITLFHEFGHALHHLLTKAELAPMAGTNVEWDFVELPSQLMENFAWEKESLQSFAKHYETGDNIPDDLLAKMIKARNFNEGLACVRQIEFALFDFSVYMSKAEELKSPNQIYKNIVEKYGIFEFIPETNFPVSFSHIFAGGYAAGYYSYKWAEVLEADAFSRFVNEGVLNPELGLAYKAAILEKGDTEPPLELFKQFVGREPNENALLERMGVETAAV